MKKLIIPAIAVFLSCSAFAQRDTIIIHTNMGTMKAVFNNDTPNHNKMFRQRMNDGAFDRTLFYRVVNGFMIQGGSPDSRDAAPGTRIGQGSTQFLVAPEFSSKHVAMRGAIAAPRLPDKQNPEKKSDCSQFFIVHGKKYTGGYLDTLEMVRNNPIKNAWWKENYTPRKAEMDSLRQVNKKEYNRRLKSIKEDLDIYMHNHPETLYFTQKERDILTTMGGDLKLDGEYTFFAQVVEGFDVIDKIARQKTDSHERPVSDMVIQSIRVK